MFGAFFSASNYSRRGFCRSRWDGPSRHAHAVRTISSSAACLGRDGWRGHGLAGALAAGLASAGRGGVAGRGGRGDLLAVGRMDNPRVPAKRRERSGGAESAGRRGDGGAPVRAGGNGVGCPAAAAEDAVAPQDVEVIADLDNVISREENRLWTEDTARY